MRGYVPLLLLKMLQKFAKKDPGTVRPSQKLIDNINYLGFPVYIGSSIYNKNGAYISNEDLKKFNDAVDDMIHDELYRWCHHPNATDMVVDYNIQRFLDFYGFSEDELPFGNVKRWYYRERERMNDRTKQIEPFTPTVTIEYSEEPKGKQAKVVQMVAAPVQFALGF